MGPSARVAAATAAAQACATLIQSVGHQTRYGPSLVTVVSVMRVQHVFIQTGWEAARTLSKVILQEKD